MHKLSPLLFISRIVLYMIFVLSCTHKKDDLANGKPTLIENVLTESDANPRKSQVFQRQYRVTHNVVFKSYSGNKADYLDNLFLSYHFSSNWIFQESLVECSLLNKNNCTVGQFIFLIEFYNEFGLRIETQKQKYRQAILPNETKRFNLAFKKPIDFHTFKIELLDAELEKNRVNE